MLPLLEGAVYNMSEFKRGNTVFLKFIAFTVWYPGSEVPERPRREKTEKGPLAERDNPLRDCTNQMINPESGLSCDWLAEVQTVKH